MKNIYLYILKYTIIILLTINAKAKNIINIENFEQLSYNFNKISPEDVFEDYDDIIWFRKFEINSIFFSNNVKVGDTIVFTLDYNKQYKAVIDENYIDVNGTNCIRARIQEYKFGYILLAINGNEYDLKIGIPELSEIYSMRKGKRITINLISLKVHIQTLKFRKNTEFRFL